jgi:hypothetical protein
VRDFGILHANSKRLIQLQQILLRVVVLQPTSKPERPPILCQHCGNPMMVIGKQLRLGDDRLC